jgi:hypothetical protein
MHDTHPHGDDTPCAAGASGVERPDSHPPDSPQRSAARSRRARLLARVYEVFPLLCPGCGTDMRILAFLIAAEPIDAILRHLGLPSTPPPLSPARGPPSLPTHLDIASSGTVMATSSTSTEPVSGSTFAHTTRMAFEIPISVRRVPEGRGTGPKRKRRRMRR